MIRCTLDHRSEGLSGNECNGRESKRLDSSFPFPILPKRARMWQELYVASSEDGDLATGWWRLLSLVPPTPPFLGERVEVSLLGWRFNWLNPHSAKSRMGKNKSHERTEAKSPSARAFGVSRHDTMWRPCEASELGDGRLGCKLARHEPPATNDTRNPLTELKEDTPTVTLW